MTKKELLMTDTDIALFKLEQVVVLNQVENIHSPADLTLEEAKLIQAFQQSHFPDSSLYHFGTPGILSAQQDEDEDGILKRTNKTSNLHGMEKLGLEGTDQVPEEAEAVLVFRGGRAELPEGIEAKTAIGYGVFQTYEVKSFEVILPGPGFAEKSGTIVNFQGKEQSLQRAIVPPRGSKPLSEMLMYWKHSNVETGVA